MKNKKKIAVLAMLIVSFLLSGCEKKEVYMDRPAEDGKYYYQNKDLGFKLTLPSEFIYYQTQRIATEDYIDIEFFVPTSDENFPQSVPGYANLITVRVYEKQAWGKVNQNEDTAIYKKFGEAKDYIQTVKIHEDGPKDWSEKWTDELKKEIKDNLGVIK